MFILLVFLFPMTDHFIQSDLTDTPAKSLSPSVNKQNDIHHVLAAPHATPLHTLVVLASLTAAKQVIPRIPHMAPGSIPHR
jgi:hypothetical protein